MEFGLEADNRAGCVRGDDGGDDGDGCWSSHRWGLRRDTVLRSVLKCQRSGYVSSFFHSFLLTSVDTVEAPYSRISHISCGSPLISTLADRKFAYSQRTEILM